MHDRRRTRAYRTQSAGGAWQCSGGKRFADGRGRSGCDREVGAYFIRVYEDWLHARQWLDVDRDEAHRPARARRFFLLAETMDTDAALSIGLVDYVVDDDAVLTEAEKIARGLAPGPTETYGGIKRLFLQTPNRSLESQLEDEAQTLAAISRTADAKEGVRAFREKRTAEFAGK